VSGLHALDAYLASLLAKLDASQRRLLARTIAVELRRRQAARIAAQRNPDGSAYAPRKPQLRHKRGSIRRAMFSRLRMAKYMRIEASPDAAVVMFADKVRRIASVHHFGLRDRVNRNGLMAEYPARQLLGLDDSDASRITDLILAHLA
jgi:phage virion morphogenesis protein